MRVTGGSGSGSAPAPDRTLEARLSAAHDYLAWLVDVFALHGLAPDDARGGLSAAGSRALGWVCRQTHQDLRTAMGSRGRSFAAEGRHRGDLRGTPGRDVRSERAAAARMFGFCALCTLTRSR